MAALEMGPSAKPASTLIKALEDDDQRERTPPALEILAPRPSRPCVNGGFKFQNHAAGAWPRSHPSHHGWPMR